MLYNHNLLSEAEQLLLSEQIQRYRTYDKLDILIETIIDDKDEFLNRKLIKKEIKTTITIIPEALKYCDGDHCEIDYSQKSGC